MTPKTADGFALRCALASRMCQVTACCVGQETSRPVDHFKCMKTGPRPESRDAWAPQPGSASFVPLDSISYDGPIGRPGPSTARLRVAEVGVLSTGQLTMALAALEFAGQSFLPDARRLDIIRGCSSRCENVAGLDSIMAGAGRILQGGGSVAQAARILLKGLSSNSCDGACRRAPRPLSVPVDSPSKQPMRLPLRRRRRFCPRACLVTSVYFKSPTAWCSRGMCDFTLEKDCREIGAPQTTAPSTIPRQRQWASAVCGQDPASSATFRPIRDQSEYTVLGGPARALFWLLRGDSCSL